MSKQSGINWLLRLKNKQTLSSLIGILVMAVFQVAQLFGLQLNVTQEQILNLVEMVLILLAGWGVIIDPTTKGSGDSKEALERTEPKGDEDNA